MKAPGDRPSWRPSLPDTLTISVPEASQLLGIGRDAAYAAAERGEIPTLQLGRSVRVPTAKLLLMLGIVFEQHEPPNDQADADREQATNRAINAGSSRSREVTLAELEQVAKVYRQNIDNNPTEAVRRHFGYSARTASRRVNQARKKDLLSRTTQGRKQA